MRKTLKITSNPQSFVKLSTAQQPRLISHEEFFPCAADSPKAAAQPRLMHSATMSKIEVKRAEDPLATASAVETPKISPSQANLRLEEQRTKTLLFKYEREIQDLTVYLAEYQRINTSLSKENQKLRHCVTDAPSLDEHQEQKTQLERALQENIALYVKVEALQLHADYGASAKQAQPSELVVEERVRELAVVDNQQQREALYEQIIEGKDAKISQLKLELEALREMFGLYNLHPDATFKERAACVLSFKGIKEQYIELLESDNKALIDKLAIARKQDTYTEVKRLQTQLYDAEATIAYLRVDLQNARCYFDELLNMERAPRYRYTHEDY